MGMTTPFPEPDSPELQRFMVRSPQEIVGLLRTLRDQGAPLNVFFGDGPAFEALALLQVDDAGGTLVLEGPSEQGRRGQCLTAPTLTVVGFADAVKLQFAVSGARSAAFEGRTVVALPMPTQLLRLQRRSSARVRSQGAGHGPVCRMPLPGRPGEHETLGVLDIGTGGLAVIAYPERIELTVGMRIDACRLDLPGVGGAVVSLRVRHIDPLGTDEKARSCGCQFVEMRAPVAAMLARYLAQSGESGCGSGRSG